jgi:hypothetical protein
LRRRGVVVYRHLRSSIFIRLTKSRDESPTDACTLVREDQGTSDRHAGDERLEGAPSYPDSPQDFAAVPALACQAGG